MKAGMIYPLACVVSLLLTGAARAAEVPPDIDGEVGVLHVYGSLTESPCRLEMSSAWQAVSLGNTATATLRAGAWHAMVNVGLEYD